MAAAPELELLCAAMSQTMVLHAPSELRRLKRENEELKQRNARLTQENQYLRLLVDQFRQIGQRLGQQLMQVSSGVLSILRVARGKTRNSNLVAVVETRDAMARAMTILEAHEDRYDGQLFLQEADHPEAMERFMTILGEHADRV